MSHCAAVVQASFLAIGMVACGSSGDNSSRRDAGLGSPDAAAPDGSVGGAPIGSAGGVVTSSDGRARITIPPGALAAPTAIHIVPTSSTVAGALGQVWEIAPSGTQFAVPATVALAYDDADLAGHTPSAVAVSTVVGGTWQALAQSNIDTTAHWATGMTTHLSPYALAATGGAATDGGGPSTDGGGPSGCVVPRSGWYLVTVNGNQSGPPYTNSLYLIGANSGDTVTFLGLLHDASGKLLGTDSSVPPVLHIAYDDVHQILYGSRGAALFVQIEPATLLATPASLPANNNFTGTMGMFSAGGSATSASGSSFVGVDSNGHVLCDDLATGKEVGLDLGAYGVRIANYGKFLGLTGTCTSSGTYHLVVVGNAPTDGGTGTVFLDIQRPQPVPSPPQQAPQPILTVLSGQPWLGAAGLSGDGKFAFATNYYRNDAGVPSVTWETDVWERGSSGSPPQDLGWRTFCGHNEMLPFLSLSMEGE